MSAFDDDDEPKPGRRHEPRIVSIAMILAIGMVTAFNLLTFGVLYDAVRSTSPGISENATQILTGWGGGIIGILGTVFGMRAGDGQRRDDGA